jgi:5,10-methylene-tetrahydrofolate dehydrogenase/methenyl tetrahydrofolate cyclohydrolase
MSEGPSNLHDGTIAVDVSTTRILGTATTVTTEKGGIGAVTTVMISEASDLVTTITR